MYVCMYVCVDSVYVYTYVCVYAYVCVCVYTYIYMYIHTYIHSAEPTYLLVMPVAEISGIRLHRRVSTEEQPKP